MGASFRLAIPKPEAYFYTDGPPHPRPMTDSPLIPNDDPMVRVARLLDHTVDELYGAITTLDRAHVDGDDAEDPRGRVIRQQYLEAPPNVDARKNM